MKEVQNRNFGDVDRRKSSVRKFRRQRIDPAELWRPRFVSVSQCVFKTSLKKIVQKHAASIAHHT